MFAERIRKAEAKRDGSPTLNNYNAGYEAIATLFPDKSYTGLSSVR